jgi:hypothetical protein
MDKRFRQQFSMNRNAVKTLFATKLVAQCRRQQDRFVRQKTWDPLIDAVKPSSILGN